MARLPTVSSQSAYRLEQIDKADGDGLFVLEDFHDCWSNSQFKRKLRSVAQRLKFSKKSVLVTAPNGKIPAELKDETVVVKFPLPQATDLEAVLQRRTSTPAVKMNLTQLRREKLVQAALGLTASQASAGIWQGDRQRWGTGRPRH